MSQWPCLTLRIEPVWDCTIKKTAQTGDVGNVPIIPALEAGGLR